MGVRNWFKRAVSPENPSTSLANPAAWLVNLFGGGASAAGIAVDRDSALSVPAVWAAVNVISRTLASLPLQVFRKTGDERELATNLPIYKLLHDAPGPELTSFRWRQMAQSHALLDGRHYSVIVRDVGGRIREIRPLDPSKVSVARVEGRLVYKHTLAGGNTETFSADRIIDIPFHMMPDGVGSVSPVERMKNAIGLSLALEQYGSRFFANDARPSVVLETPGKMSEQATLNLAKSVAEKFSGVENSFKVMVLEEGAKLHVIGVQPNNAQFLETRRLQIEEIARVYNLPPTFLQDLTHGTFSNTEQQDLHFLKHTMRPWLVAWEQELNLKLFANRPGLFVEFNVDGIVRADFKTRMDGLAKQVQNALMTPNEGRKLLNRAPKDGGDKLMIQQNMSEIGALGEEEGDEGDGQGNTDSQDDD